MQEKIRALYYPDFFVDQRTLVREILLFDEIHFMDRPSIMFGFATGSQFGTVGADSPLRQFEASFRENGIPLFVHKPYSGPISEEWYESVKADISDLNFLERFVEGLQSSPVFRDQMISKGSYGDVGNETDVLAAILSVELKSLERYGGAIALFEDTAVRHMDLQSIEGRAKYLIATAAICSAKLNSALDTGAREGFSPLADAAPFGDLLAQNIAAPSERWSLRRHEFNSQI